MTDTMHLTTAPPGINAGLPGHVWPIHSAVTIAESVDICRHLGQIGLVTGPSGIGKTTAVRAVIAALADAEDAEIEARCVMMTRAADGLQPGLLRLAKAIGVYVQPNAGGADIYDAMVAHIEARWRHGSVLVLDEAQFMSEALIDALRNLADDLRGSGRAVGIVMVGTPDLAARISGKLGGRAKHFEPLRGRLYMAELDGLAPKDFATIAGKLGMAGAQATNLIAKAGAGRGGLHNVERIVTAARQIAGPGKALSLGNLRTAMQGLGVVS
jgi:type II secretory pathway predicted ATPase ExeA